MSDIVDRLRDTASCAGCIVDRERAAEAADTITRLRADIISYKIGNKDLQDHCAEITSLTAEQDALASDKLDEILDEKNALIERLTAENEKLRVALRECEAELNAYYRMEYAGSHPYSQQELAQAMASNPATVALSGEQQ